MKERSGYYTNRKDCEPTISYEIAVKSVHSATPFGAR